MSRAASAAPVRLDPQEIFMSHHPCTTVRPAPNEPPFSLSTEDTGPVTVVRARGEIDRETAPALTGHVDDLVAAHSPLLLVLDLAEVKFLDAAGITALLHVRDALDGHGGHLVLREPSEQVRTVLRLGRVAGLFDVKEAGPARGIHIPSGTG
jgi:anti-sigma B factor antagonist